MKLARRGHNIPESSQTNMLRLRKAREVMETGVKTIPAETLPEELGRLVSEEPLISYFLVAGPDRKITGVIEKIASPAILEKCGIGLSTDELSNKDFTFVAEDTPVSEIISLLHGGKASVALVISKGPQETDLPEVKGVITEKQLSAAALESIAGFTE